MPPPKGPGLAKVRKVQVVSAKRLDLVALRGGWWAAMVERADVISEGAVEHTPDGRRVYYGTTSLRCVIDDEMIGATPAADDPALLARVIVADPHARLRVLRLAHREAVARADSSLDVLHAEIAARALEEPPALLLSIDVDVSAELTGGDDDGEPSAHRHALDEADTQ
jgi:hypothetical protein